MIYGIKLSTLNKRFLHLCDEVQRQIDPYLKATKLFLFVMAGSEKYRLQVLKEIAGRLSVD